MICRTGGMSAPHQLRPFLAAAWEGGHAIRWLGTLRFAQFRRGADLRFAADGATTPAPHCGFERIAVGSLMFAATSFLLAACATSPQRRDGIAKVNPASIAAAPATWDGRQVEIVGLVVWESGDFGLYQSYGAYCRGAERAAIYAHWEEWAGVSPRDSRRRAIVRGLFRNREGMKQPDGSALVSAGAPGPGPLEPGVIVRWLSNPQRPCPNRR